MSRVKKFTSSLLNRKNNKKEAKFISPLAYMNSNTFLESHTYIDRFCVLHDTKVSSYTYLGYGCKLNNVEIGRYTSLASDIKIGLGKHPVHLLSTSPIFYSKLNPFKILVDNPLNFDDRSQKTIIGNDVWIGANVIIMDGVKIGDGAVIGAGSIVTKDVAPYSIVVGTPAKEIKKRFNDDMIQRIIDSKWWEHSPEAVSQMPIYREFRGN